MQVPRFPSQCDHLSADCGMDLAVVPRLRISLLPQTPRYDDSLNSAVCPHSAVIRCFTVDVFDGHEFG